VRRARKHERGVGRDAERRLAESEVGAVHDVDTSGGRAGTGATCHEF